MLPSEGLDFHVHAGRQLHVFEAGHGVPLVQHRMAFFSDAIGHSAFTGVALGLILGISPSWTVVAFGAVVAVAIVLVRGRTGLSADTVTGVFFSAVVALGIAVISRERGLTRNLQAFLYGDLLAVTDAELAWMAVLSVLVAGYLLLLTLAGMAFGRIRHITGSTAAAAGATRARSRRASARSRAWSRSRPASPSRG